MSATPELKIREAGSPIALEFHDNADAVEVRMTYRAEGMEAEAWAYLSPAMLDQVQAWINTVRERRGI